MQLLPEGITALTTTTAMGIDKEVAHSLYTVMTEEEALTMTGLDGE